MRQLSYLGKLSDKDYSGFSSFIDQALTGAGATEINRTKVCYYNNPHLFTNNLECYAEAAGYQRINNEQDAAQLTKRFEAALQSQGTFQGNFSDFYAQPLDGSASLLLRTKAQQKGACTVTVTTGEGQQTLSQYLPKKDLTGKIAYFLSCGGQSREKYFQTE